jgi:hypothetical protein
MLALAQMTAGRLDKVRHALDEGTRLARASANTSWEADLPVHLARLAMLGGDLRSHRLATADSAITFISSAIARQRRGMTDGDLSAGLAQRRLSALKWLHARRSRHGTRAAQATERVMPRWVRVGVVSSAPAVRGQATSDRGLAPERLRSG